MAKTQIDLLRILSDAGIEALHEQRTEIKGSCPKHEERTGQPDHHPSWYINKFTYVHFCHSCHYTGTLTQLLVDLTGSAPVDLELDLKAQSFLRKMAKVREEPGEVLAPVIPLLTEWGLRHLPEVPDRLLKLKYLQRDAIDRYQVRWNRDTRQWVLPVRSPAGDLLGAQYRQQGSVLTLPKGMEKSTTLFGYSEMSQHDYVALVESPLDAVRLFGLGIPAVAALGSWISSAQVTLLARAFAVVYLALDNDKAGLEGMEYTAPRLRRNGAAVTWWDYTGLVDEEGRKAKDVGDVPDDGALLESWQRTRRWL